MSHIDINEHTKGNSPTRSLREDFTDRVIHNAVRAKRRSARKKKHSFFVTEIFSMKLIKHFRTIPGAALAVGIVATSGVGVYALNNWFGGNVSIKQTASVFSIDLSSCKGPLPPGVNQEDDRHAVRFKITGSPHISAQDLQQDLLGECEYEAVVDFYAAKFPDAGFSSVGHPASVAQAFKYVLHPGVIVGVHGASVTVKSTGDKSDSFGTRTLTLAPNSSVYDESRAASIASLQPGDNVIFVAYSASASGPVTEGTTILDNTDVQLQSVFKTQYHDSGVPLYYSENNIVPLDMLTK